MRVVTLALGVGLLLTGCDGLVGARADAGLDRCADPATPRARPENVTATVEGLDVVVRWQLDQPVGSCVPESFTVIAQPALVAPVVVPGSAREARVTGLPVGKDVSFRVTSEVPIADRLWSSSNTVVTYLPPAPLLELHVGFPSDGTAEVSWALPTDPDRPVDTVEVSLLPDGPSFSVRPTELRVTFAGIVPATDYRFQVTASGLGGTTSLVRPLVSPAVPSEPTGLVAIPRPQGFRLSWTPPSTDRGHPITGYRVLLQPRAREFQYGVSEVPLTVDCAGPSAPCDVSGLEDDITFELRLVAVNSEGAGMPSVPTSATTPGVPRGFDFVGEIDGRGECWFKWSPPQTDPAFPITGYILRTFDRSSVTMLPPEARSGYLTGLAVPSAPAVELVAVNEVGERPLGWVCTSSDELGQVTDIRYEPRPGGVWVAWTPPSGTGGEALTSFDVWTYGDPTLVTVDGGTTEVVVTGLDPGWCISPQIRANTASYQGQVTHSMYTEPCIHPLPP